jgi:hypothetical protein
MRTLTKFISAAFAVLILAVGAVTANDAGKTGEALPTSRPRQSDLTLSGIQGATVTGVAVVNGNLTTEFTLNIPTGGSLTASIAAGAITDQLGQPNVAFSGSYPVAPFAPRSSPTPRPNSTPRPRP